MAPKVLVTGGNGFVGSHLAERLRSRGFDVVVLDLWARQYPAGSEPEQIIGDLFQPSLAERAWDGIVHLAAVSRVSDGEADPIACLSVNVLGTAQVLEIAGRCGSSPWVVLGSTLETPTSVYGLSKQFAEQYATLRARARGISLATVRCSAVYGSERDNQDKLIPKLVARALRGEPIMIDNGARSFDFVHVSDVVRGIEATMALLTSSTPAIDMPIPICTGRLTSLRKIVSLITGYATSSSSVTILADEPEAAVPPNAELARKLLGFEAGLSLEEGIAATVAHARKNLSGKFVMSSSEAPQ